MLTKNNKEYLKEMLTQNLSDITLQINKEVMDSSEIRDRSYDLLDRATFEISDKIASRITERQSKVIKKINLSLEKLTKGDYGICEECGEEIPHQRLMARPIAALCIDCKREQEHMEQQRKP